MKRRQILGPGVRCCMIQEKKSVERIEAIRHKCQN